MRRSKKQQGERRAMRLQTGTMMSGDCQCEGGVTTRRVKEKRPRLGVTRPNVEPASRTTPYGCKNAYMGPGWAWKDWNKKMMEKILGLD